MSEPALKCENNAIFKQNYTQKLFISVKIFYTCCFGLRGNLEFPNFLQKKFYNINYGNIAMSSSGVLKNYQVKFFLVRLGKRSGKR